MLPKFEAVKKLDGFDNTVSPNWLMVGSGTEKSVILLDGNNLSVNIRNPAVAEIVGDVIKSAASPQRIITIKGKTKGTTFVDVSDGKSVKNRLEICVKNRREVRVSFHYVKDINGIGTERNHSELISLIYFINSEIFLPQANVFVKIGVVNAPLRINRVLGEVVRDTSEFPDIPKSEHEVDYIMSFRDRAANINVFFVKDVEKARNPTENLIGGTQYDTGIFIDDKFKNERATITTVIAHEIAHYLGVGGDSHYFKINQIDGLMYFKARGGMRISKVHANMINR